MMLPLASGRPSRRHSFISAVANFERRGAPLLWIRSVFAIQVIVDVNAPYVNFAVDPRTPRTPRITRTPRTPRNGLSACLTLIRSKATNAGIPFGHNCDLKSSPEHFLRG